MDTSIILMGHYGRVTLLVKLNVGGIDAIFFKTIGSV
jgi:hypothetical protein